MQNQFLTNYTETTFLDKIKDNLRHCKSFYFSVSFIKKAGLVLLFKDIEAAVERGCNGYIITSTYQNFTDIESLKSFHALRGRFTNFQCHSIMRASMIPGIQLLDIIQRVISLNLMIIGN